MVVGTASLKLASSTKMAPEKGTSPILRNNIELCVPFKKKAIIENKKES